MPLLQRYVNCTVNCSERSYFKKFKYIQLGFVISFLHCNSAVMIVVPTASAQTRTAELFIHLIQCWSPRHVR